MIAQVAGLLTIVLAVWTWRAEKRRWLRMSGLAALGTVIAQGILGGITVLFYLPPLCLSAHAALAQTFFCIAVALRCLPDEVGGGSTAGRVRSAASQPFHA